MGNICRTNKIADKFEQDTYRIIDQPRPEIPVYKIKSEESGVEKILHRNLLVKIEDGVETDESDKAQEDSVAEEDVATDDRNDEEGSNDHDVMREETDEEDGDSVDEEIAEESEGVQAGSLEEDVVQGVEDEEDTVTDGVDEDHPVVEDEEEGIKESLEGQVETEIPEVETEIEQKEVEAVEKVQTSLPTPAPRRSARSRKPPDRYGDYVSKSINQRPFDTTVHALGELMKSGLVNNVDSDTAHRIIAAIMDK